MEAVPAELVGREHELAAVDAWVRGLRVGPSALVLRGAPGIGKTTLWAAALDRAAAAGAMTLVARPAEAELPLGYAALGDLLGEVAPAVLATLAPPLARALGAALLLERDDRGPGDPLAVARATKTVLERLAGDGALVVAVDDVQWLDPASARALAFAVRRLGAASVGVLASAREGHDDPLDLRGALDERARELPVGGLSAGATGHLLRTRVNPAFSRLTALRIHERSGGNPFFALELGRTPEGERLPDSLRALVERRLAAVPAPARPAVEWAAVLGTAPPSAFPDGESVDAACRTGVLIEEAGTVRFSHPLLAAGAYERIPPARRRALHGRAAAQGRGVEQQARHRALAADGPDAAVAALLEDAARVARMRGATEFAAELAAHATQLTPPEDAESRARRRMDEADYLYVAADEPAARRRVDEVLASRVRGEVRVRALIHRALHAVEPTEAVAQLEQAVGEPHGDALLAARALSLLAWQRGAWLGDVATALPEATAAVQLAERLDDESTLATALTTAALMSSLTGDKQAEVYFTRAVEIADRWHMAPGNRAPRSAFAHHRFWRADWTGAEELLDREREEAARHGAVGQLMRLAVFRAELELRRGGWAEAERLIEAALVDARDYWRIAALVVRCQVRGRRGDRRALADADEIAASPFAGGHAVVAATAEYARGLIDLAAGNTERAAHRLAVLAGTDGNVGAYAEKILSAIPDAVLALVEAGRSEEAERLTERLELRAAKGDQPWAAAAAPLCRGAVLLAAGDTAAALATLVDARDRLDRLGVTWELARTLLVLGAALRRAGRRTDAAAALDRAIALFARLGAPSWRERAVGELRGARPRPRRDDALTAAERRVAALVAAGRTNKEVAAQLFTTVATVEAHLTRVYRKLGVRSRTELAGRAAEGRVDVGGG